MPHYCPNCRAEYEESVLSCSDCRVDLKPGAAPSDDVASGWVVLRTVGTDDEAALLAGFLENEGIESTIEPVNAHAIPETIGELSGIHILVRDEKRSEAHKLLEERESAFAASRSDDEAILTHDGVAHMDAADELAD